jgi:hypothetical protein
MKTMKRRFSAYLLMGLMIVIISPMLVSGYTLRYVDCHCAEELSSCSLPTTTSSENELPACCQSDKQELPENHGCQDQCCIKELHFEGIDLDYYQFNYSDGRAIQPLVTQTLVVMPALSNHSPVLSSDTSPPNLLPGRELLIQIHQLKIASPYLLLA